MMANHLGGFLIACLTLQVSAVQQHTVQTPAYQMISHFSDGRCRGRRNSDFFDLGFGLSLAECLDRCITSTSCNFVLHGSANGGCTSFSDCRGEVQRDGLNMYEKVPSVFPTPPSPTPSPTTSESDPDQPGVLGKMVRVFGRGEVCDASQGLLNSLRRETVEQCAEECLFDDECNFADMANGVCRTLTQCDSTTPSSEDGLMLKKISRQSFNSPQWMMTCPKAAAMTTECMSLRDYDDAVASVKDLVRGLPTRCTTEACPEADFSGCILRMAGHDFMDFRNGQGGSDACTDMDDADNAGLAECLFEGEFGEGTVSLNDAYMKFCDRISLADFIVIAAEAV
eukprot:CAMPEP_0170589000 /NCGR_PEP_ID=MMETSP0224-20130122/11125_1 /TAXON_ID=285029 /ORGANISM="Togula jolla, Strain CCCM 725" /LENGTH=339 /DNA_ID=CAMNT_0010912745 /DNA_START=64 /DNA_END=1079 /DNA_ORIENTATION=+